MPNSKKNIKLIIKLLKEEYRNSAISLDFSNPYELLIATILSAQTTDKAVNKVTPKLFKKYPNVGDLAEANLQEIIEIINSIGLYNTKARNIIKSAKRIIEEYNGNIPSNMKDLLTLSGVGRKTANVVLGNAFGIKDSGITVDTHMIRICNLLGWVKEKEAGKIEKELITLIPLEEWVNITHLIIFHGRKICIARRPKCEKCVLEKFCPGSKFKNKK